MLHPLTDFIEPDALVINTPPSYWYEGGPKSERLPRTALAEAIAKSLMQQLIHEQYQEGKMYGVLLVETPSGEQRVLEAFSGLLNGSSQGDGWVPPLPGRERVAFEEAHTLQELERLKQALISLQQMPERQTYTELSKDFAAQLQALKLAHQQRRCDRQQQRQTLAKAPDHLRALALTELDNQSRQAGIEQKLLKRQRDSVLQPLKAKIAWADAQMLQLKQERKARSRQLQAEMHAAYSLSNFSGQLLALTEVITAEGIPSGTGDCCAPKLLHYAAAHALKPLAMAEFWWGRPMGDKIAGQFYGACAERCQPLLGFLLAGISEPAIADLELVYEDEWLIVVNKPAGLLSVPGRYGDRQDSVLSRLSRPDRWLQPVHRLDQATSGLLLLATDPDTQRQLNRQFEQRQVNKVYEAVLAGRLSLDQGMIDLPLWTDPGDRPYQKVDWQQGKPSQTRFQVIARTENTTRVEFFPITGRTHQLRVHAADPQGLGLPIVGDRLYGDDKASSRLHLHSRSLSFQHPQSGQPIQLTVETPF
jgi:tRNA pseudouridine32 synthase / 23S rRNA pseudouridine746 synthase